MSRCTPRAKLHAALELALTAMATTWNDTDLRGLTGDVWHPAASPFADLDGLDLQPATRDHLGYSIAFERGTPGRTAQRAGAFAAQLTEARVYFAMEYMPSKESAHYRRALDACELVSHTISATGWHAGAAVVDITEDMAISRHPEKPLLICAVSFTLTSERRV